VETPLGESEAAMLQVKNKHLHNTIILALLNTQTIKHFLIPYKKNAVVFALDSANMNGFFLNLVCRSV
jgi:NAD/NADP transhydrogenase alpha subunit